MNIIERGRAFLAGLRGLAERTAWDWRRCVHCDFQATHRHGTYTRRPWTLTGRQTMVVQRYRCPACGRTYSETSPYLVRGGRYAREVRRAAIDQWQHTGSSLRRTAEWLRSLMGRQERWRLWRPLDPGPESAARCRLHASSVQRWLDRAGQQAQASVVGQLQGIPTSGQVATDGLWARLRGGTRVVLLGLVDCVTGVVYPPVVVPDEAQAAHWARLFTRAAAAGLDRRHLRGVVSDGAAALGSYLDRALLWVHHQRCIFHLWRTLTPRITAIAHQASAGLAAVAATAVRRTVWQTVRPLIRAVLDARADGDAIAALRQLAAHPWGTALARALAVELPAALAYQTPVTYGLGRVSPEWLWRDFRLRLSHGRNHPAPTLLERAGLRWAIYRNFEPAQRRVERRRRYRHPGRSPLAVAGVPPGPVSYLDALAV